MSDLLNELKKRAMCVNVGDRAKILENRIAQLRDAADAGKSYLDTDSVDPPWLFVHLRDKHKISAVNTTHLVRGVMTGTTRYSGWLENEETPSTTRKRPATGLIDNDF